MTTPEELRRATENTLYGLTADESLKFRILQKAARQPEPHTRRSLRLVPVLCTVLAAFLVVVIALNTLQPVPSAGPGEMNVFAAGKSETAEKTLFPAGFDTDGVISVKLNDSATVTDPVQCAALVSVLLDSSGEAADSGAHADGNLIITSSDGSELTFGTDDPYLIGKDGRRWYCPGFFSEIAGMAD